MINKIIGLSGLARSGKDTFFSLLSEKLLISGKKLTRFALADALKEEINPTLQKLYDINIFNCNSQEKELVRPMLVAHGKVKRNQSYGRHWINLLNNKIQEHLNNNPHDFICVTDIRYDVFDNDEVGWIKNELKGTLVHISMFKYENGNKIFQEPPNADEAENDPKLIKKANYRVIWPKAIKTNGQMDFELLNTYVEEFIKYLNR